MAHEERCGQNMKGKKVEGKLEQMMNAPKAPEQAPKPSIIDEEPPETDEQILGQVDAMVHWDYEAVTQNFTTAYKTVVKLASDYRRVAAEELYHRQLLQETVASL